MMISAQVADWHVCSQYDFKQSFLELHLPETIISYRLISANLCGYKVY